MDGNIKDTPPIILVPRTGGPRRAGTCRRQGTGRRSRSRSRPASRPPAPTSTSGWPAPSPTQVAEPMPADGLQLHAPLSEGSGNDGAARRSTASRATVEAGDRLGRRARRRQGVAASGRRRARDRRRRRLREGPGVLLRRLGQVCRTAPTGADRRPHGRPARLPRLGPLDRERPRRHAHHQQVAGRRAQGRRAGRRSSRTSGTTCSSPTTARARRPASRSTSTASRRPTDVAGRHAQEHDPHDGAVQARPAAHARRGSTTSRFRTCASTAAP